MALLGNWNVMKGPIALRTGFTPITWFAMPYAAIHPATWLLAHLHRYTFAAWVTARRQVFDRRVATWQET